MNETLTHWLIEVEWRNVWNNELCHHKLSSGLLPNQLQASNRICYAPFSNKSRGLSCSKIINLIFIYKNAFEGNVSLICQVNGGYPSPTGTLMIILWCDWTSSRTNIPTNLGDVSMNRITIDSPHNGVMHRSRIWYIIHLRSSMTIKNI